MMRVLITSAKAPVTGYFHAEGSVLGQTLAREVAR